MKNREKEEKRQHEVKPHTENNNKGVNEDELDPNV